MDVPAETLPVRGRDGVRRRHAGTGVAPRRAEGDARGQEAVEVFAAARRQQASRLTGSPDLRKDCTDVPVKTVFRHQRVEFVQHRRVIRQCLAVDGEHAGGFADAEDIFARQQVMHIARERGDVGDVLDVRFAVQDGLIQVRGGPALRDVEAEGLGQLVRGLAGHGVLPGAEGREQVPVFIKGQIAVHHAGDAHRGDLARQLAEVADRRAQALLHVFHVVRPHAVFQTAFPGIVAAFYDRMLLVKQHCFDPCRAEFDAEKNTVSYLSPQELLIFAGKDQTLNYKEQAYHTSYGDICPPCFVQTEGRNDIFDRAERQNAEKMCR